MAFDHSIYGLDEGSLSLLICVGGVLGAMIVDGAARAFRRTTARYAGHISQCGLSGRHVAQRLLAACGLANVVVSRGAKMDVYGPWRRQIHLTDATFDTPSIWSLAAVAHEVGHAQQFAEGIRPARWWRLVAPLCVAIPILLVVAILLSFFGVINVALTTISMMVPVMFVVLALLQIPLHLPLERDASKRARELVRGEGLVDDTELSAFDELLRAAWKTHLALHVHRWIMLIVVVAVVAFVPSFLVPSEPDEYLAEYADAQAVPFVDADTAQEFTPHEVYSPDDLDLPENVFTGLFSSIGFMALSILPLVLLFVVLSKLEKFVKRKPTGHEQAVQHNNAASALQAQGKSEAAIKEYTRAIDANPELTIAWHNRGQVHFSLGRLDEALSDFDVAIRLAPQLVDALAARGYVRALKDDLDGALADCNDALRTNPQSDVALSCRGVVYQARGEYDRAIHDFDAALGLEPERWDVYRDRGLAWLRQGQFERAIADTDQALRLNPNDPLAYNNRGVALLKLGEYSRALADLGTAIRLEPKIAHPYKHTAWIHATCPHDDLRDGLQAVANATRAIELTQGKQTEWFATLAAAHAEAGNFHEAIQWQQKCLEASPPDTKPEMQVRLELYHRGRPFRDCPVVDSPATSPMEEGLAS